MNQVRFYFPRDYDGDMPAFTLHGDVYYVSGVPPRIVWLNFENDMGLQPDDEVRMSIFVSRLDPLQIIDLTTFLLEHSPETLA